MKQIETLTWIEPATDEEGGRCLCCQQDNGCDPNCNGYRPESPYRMVTASGARFALSTLDAIRAQKSGVPFKAVTR